MNLKLKISINIFTYNHLEISECRIYTKATDKSKIRFAIVSSICFWYFIKLFSDQYTKKFLLYPLLTC